jgi:hypothetical protein
MQEYISISGFSVVTTAARQNIDLPEIMIDPITMSHFVRPIYLKESGRIYEHSTLLKWIEKSPTDPITRIPLTIESFKIIPALNIFAAEICIEFEAGQYYYWPPQGSLLSLLTFCSEIFMEDNVTVYFETFDKILLEQILYCCPFTGVALGGKYRISTKGMPMSIDCDIENDASEICFTQESEVPVPPPLPCEDHEIIPHKFIIMAPSVELEKNIHNYIRSSEIYQPRIKKINSIIRNKGYTLQNEMYHLRKFFMIPVMFNTEFYVDYSFLNVSNLYVSNKVIVRHIFIYTSFTHVRYIDCIFVGCIFHSSCKAFDFEFESCKFIQCVDELDE